ncbi:MAG TPA: haloacid dehalogenase type II [Candidatus Binatia bacterium]|nr:haloacid dehalogenase type II [Candidatus Binatia bacterium]
MFDLSHFEWLSFDCYGTLIDWESGILGYLQPLLQRKSCVVSDAQVLQLYSEIEPREQAGEYRSYREVLAAVVRDFARELRFEVTDSEARGLAGSIREWQPFPDTVAGLRRLHSRYRLAILSNIDDELFAHSARKLQVDFECVATAQQAGSYKPSLNNFQVLLRRLEVPRDRLLHVAESLYHDVAPARSLGIATVWVNRRKGKAAAASKLADVKPDMEVPDIAALAEAASVSP